MYDTKLYIYMTRIVKVVKKKSAQGNDVEKC